MDSWRPHLHWSFRQERVLFEGLVLRSFTDFLIASLFLTTICLFERFLSFNIEQGLSPRFLARIKWGKRVWWAALYWIIHFIRLCYMLASMTLHVGIIIVIVGDLQLAILPESVNVTSNIVISFVNKCNREDAESRALLIPSSYPLHPVTERTRPRSKSKQHKISIHPIRSGMTRAEAMNSQSCSSGDTESVQYSGDEVPKGILEMRSEGRNNAKEKKGFLSSGSDSDSESGD
ncbi:hypothetical protein AGABI2DRAFT_62197 [Agaricus bisporus var. bisporus H97]|uniref:hypothetical protein n=1 Tax=Agaricus bisporus var. bisporus (strain H97 / ATCC MYA-4626 / FGSC 10389) TaxID=936046 RepID=UPI00029F5DF5|nr:hypothetical protein AGABI2DRAFT_62197 [Agaricus bisporus var. bisporus H97]EKV51189.1 hypothetical protein AGABI2DRAFT_62197 [Agaricus bisporus var. bisporus H97]